MFIERRSWTVVLMEQPLHAIANDLTQRRRSYHHYREAILGRVISSIRHICLERQREPQVADCDMENSWYWYERKREMLGLPSLHLTVTCSYDVDRLYRFRIDKASMMVPG